MEGQTACWLNGAALFKKKKKTSSETNSIYSKSKARRVTAGHLPGSDGRCVSWAYTSGYSVSESKHPDQEKIQPDSRDYNAEVIYSDFNQSSESGAECWTKQSVASEFYGLCEFSDKSAIKLLLSLSESLREKTKQKENISSPDSQWIDSVLFIRFFIVLFTLQQQVVDLKTKENKNITVIRSPYSIAQTILEKCPQLILWPYHTVHRWFHKTWGRLSASWESLELKRKKRYFALSRICFILQQSLTSPVGDNLLPGDEVMVPSYVLMSPQWLLSDSTGL